jgi:hypothetical protein
LPRSSITSRSLPIVLLVALCSALLLSCGGSDDDGATSAGGDAPGGDGSGSDTQATEAPGDGGPAASSDGDSCRVLQTIFIDPDISEDIGLAEVEALLGALAEAGPEAIREDLGVFARDFGGYFARLAEMGIESAEDLDDVDDEQLAELTELSTSLRTPEVIAAEGNILRYVERECEPLE